jgi:choline transport protein
MNPPTNTLAGLGTAGYAINFIAFILIIFFNIMFCFPYALPAEVATMNYNSVILVGVTFLTVFWWLVHGLRKYPGPKLAGFDETDEGRRLSTV